MDIPSHLREELRFQNSLLITFRPYRATMKLSNYAAKALQSPSNMPPNGYEPITHRKTGQINLGFTKLPSIIYKYERGTKREMAMEGCAVSSVIKRNR